jgi:hypothetical protein
MANNTLQKRTYHTAIIHFSQGDFWQKQNACLLDSAGFLRLIAPLLGIEG